MPAHCRSVHFLLSRKRHRVSTYGSSRKSGDLRTVIVAIVTFRIDTRPGGSVINLPLALRASARQGRFDDGEIG